MKYKRFVAYVYEYRKGKKENNCGFLRVEERDEKIIVEVHMKCPGLPSDEKCSIYGFVRNAGLLEGILLGDAWSGEEKLDCMIESDKTGGDSWKNAFSEFGGIIIRTENGAFFGTEWDDHPIKPENFDVRKTLEKADESSDNEQDCTPERESIQETELIEKELPDSTDIENTPNSVCMQETENKQPAFCPFDDDEISECRKIHPNEFFKSCPRACALRNNRFLEHGYYNFGHLIVGERANGQRILGVPGGYDQQERFMANMFGFPYFKESHEIKLPGGRGGYWYRLINPSNFH